MCDYERARSVLTGEINLALNSVDGAQVEKLAGMICTAERVFVVGVGRVLLMLQAMVKRLNHLGIEATYVGAIDEPAITQRDLLIVGSGSGESLFPAAISRKAKKYGARIVHIGSNPRSTVGEVADLFVRIPCRTKLNLEDEIDSSQPMSSLFEQCLLILGDILACMIIESRGLDLKLLWRRHANLE